MYISLRRTRLCRSLGSAVPSSTATAQHLLLEGLALLPREPTPVWRTSLTPVGSKASLRGSACVRPSIRERLEGDENLRVTRQRHPPWSHAETVCGSQQLAAAPPRPYGQRNLRCRWLPLVGQEP